MKIKTFTLMHLLLVIGVLVLLMGAMQAYAQVYDGSDDFGITPWVWEKPEANNPYLEQQFRERWSDHERVQRLQRIEQRMFENQMLEEMREANRLRGQNSLGQNNRPVACGLVPTHLYARPGC